MGWSGGPELPAGDRWNQPLGGGRFKSQCPAIRAVGKTDWMLGEEDSARVQSRRRYPGSSIWISRSEVVWRSTISRKAWATELGMRSMVLEAAAVTEQRRSWSPIAAITSPDIEPGGRLGSDWRLWLDIFVECVPSQLSASVVVGVKRIGTAMYCLHERGDCKAHSPVWSDMILVGLALHFVESCGLSRGTAWTRTRDAHNTPIIDPDP